MGEPLRKATTELAETSCCVCGIAFSVPRSWLNQRIEKGGDFYCPNGHPLGYGETKVARLERELKEEQNRHWQTRSELRQEKGKQEKLEKRIWHGVCPYCKRMFQNVARHMKCKHKD